MYHERIIKEITATKEIAVTNHLCQKLTKIFAKNMPENKFFSTNSDLGVKEISKIIRTEK